MKINKIFKDLDVQIYGDDSVEIDGLFHESNKVKGDGLFFAIEGTKVDGKIFIGDAIKRGAKAIVSNKKVLLPEGIVNIVCQDEREAMSLAANNFYGKPSQDMFVVGVTGTNGKTTTTFMLESMFKSAGKKVGIIGTNGVYIDGQKIDVNLTTPDPIYLQKTLRKMRDSGVDVVCMEVSAHALELQKIRGVMTDIALFTNLTQDHLDFFLNMENYYNAKADFFGLDYAKYGVINYDDPYGKRLFEQAKIPCLAYARGENVRNNRQANFRVVDILAVNEKHTKNGQSFDIFTIKGNQNIKIKLKGGFNVSNALGVVGAGILSGLSLTQIAKGLEQLEKVDGRFNSYDLAGRTIIIDYAHTPDGLENILVACNELKKENKVYCVFGCGGNRDKDKRPKMGRIASELADYVIITSDNPRFEDPLLIAREIESGVVSENYEIQEDREDAIRKAISLSKKGDVILIAGKGSEPYIDINGVKKPYQDELVIKEILEELEK